MRPASILKKRLSRRYQVLMVCEGLLVGLLAGAIVTLYRMSLTLAERSLRSIIAVAAGHPVLMGAWAAALVLLCLAVGALVHWEPNSAGSGIPQVDAEVIGKLDMSWPRVLVAKFLEGTLCALGGLSLGREGPSVQLGGMSGKCVSRLLGRDRGEERLLVTCGAAAGMSAAFNAPLTGVLFALEEIHREFNAPLIIAVMGATISADFFVSHVLGVQPVLQFVITTDLPHAYYLYVLLFGVACGAAGALHNEGMFVVQDKLFARIKHGAPFSRYAIAFACAGVAAFMAPDLLCGGDAIVEQILRPNVLPMATILALLVGKYALTSICFGSGAPGGTLFPLVVMGSLFGALFGAFAVRYLSLPPQFVVNFVVLGIGGLFASVIRAPVTAVVLSFELTGSLDTLLSVAIVSIASYLIANFMLADPFYEHLLFGVLRRLPKDPEATSAGRIVKPARILVTHTVGAGSAAENKTLSQIAWPGLTRVVSISRAGVEIVPTGDTVLLAMDEILVITDEKSLSKTEEFLVGLTSSKLVGERARSSR